MPRRIPEPDRAFLAAYGPALRRAITAAGHSGATLARALNLREFQIQRWLRGEGTAPPLELQAKIAALVGPIEINGTASTVETKNEVHDRYLQVVELAKRDIAAALPGLRPSQVKIRIEL